MIADNNEAGAKVDEAAEDAESESRAAEGAAPQMAAPPPGEAVDTLDPLGIGRASLDVWQAMLANPDSILKTQLEFANAWMSVAAQSFAPRDAKREPLIAPARTDSRFKHAAWTENPIFDALKQGYLLATKAVLDGIDRADVDPETKQRVKFFAKQFCDAMSPTNFAFLNPAVIEETLKTGGRNLERGAQNIVEDLRENSGRPALVDKKAFTVGKNIATTPGTVVFRNDLIELIEYTPTTETVYAKPLVIVPPWINKFYILDLQPSNSLIKFAVDSGFRTFVVSWRNVDASLAGMGWKDYLELGPLTACRAASCIAESNDVNLIGYCIGGTLSAEMLAYLARRGELLVNAATFFAALTDFEDAGEIRAFLGPEAMAFIEDTMKKKGILDGSQMADTFNMLRANDLIWNVAVNRYLMGKDAPAFDLLYWNSDATRLPAKMHRYYLRNMYIENDLVKPDKLRFKGVPIDLRVVRNDAYVVATAEDHIAPWRSVYKVTQLFSGDVQFRLGHSGHIAGIINPPASGKGSYWSASSNPTDPDEWLALATEHAGSWWTDWQAWLGRRAGERVPAPSEPGSERFKPSDPAPGRYVLEKA